MKNLLAANQKEFVATIDKITRKGKVLVTKVNGNPLFVSLAYGKYSLPVGNGSNHDLITKGITNFRLLEPESKEEKIQIIASQLADLKQKYPLAFDTIKLPVRYDPEYGQVVDAKDEFVLSITKEGLPFSRIEWQRQDQIGELIAELLNQLQ